MNETEQAIIFKLYFSPGYTHQLDYNQPIVQGLLARKYIYMGGQQQVSLDIRTNCIPAFFTLQPFVYQSLNHHKDKLEKKINRLEQKLQKRKTSNRISKRLDSLKDEHSVLSDGF